MSAHLIRSLKLFYSRLGPRFPALSRTYDRDLRNLAKKKASELGFDSFIREGVYSYQVGPPYETIAECRMLLGMGVDVTGMSKIYLYHESRCSLHVFVYN